MKWLLNRLREPSTGAGLAILAQALKLAPNLAPYGDALGAITASAAAHAVLMPEREAK